MGWMWGYNKPENVSKWFADKLTGDRGGRIDRCLATAIVERKEAYAAVESVYPDGKREVWAAVFELGYSNNNRDGLKFGYRDQEESQGPLQERCPEFILDLLTETDSKYAKSWRAACRERLERRSVNKFEGGEVVRSRHPIYFGPNHGSADTFRVDKSSYKVSGRTVSRFRFIALDSENGGTRFFAKIANWRDISFERIPPDQMIGQKPADEEEYSAPAP